MSSGRLIAWLNRRGWVFWMAALAASIILWLGIIQLIAWGWRHA